MKKNIELVDVNKYSNLFSVEQRKEALKTALDTRKFEIDLYWKRTTYFWAFTAATFTAYFVLLASDKIDKGFTIVVAAIGFFFSFGWYFVNRASKFWQENWEDHVSSLGRDIQGPLYDCIKIPKDKLLNITGYYPFSVSKVNQMLSFMMTVFWFLTFIYSIFFSFGKLDIFNCLNVLPFWPIFFSLIFFLVILAIFFKYFSHSFLKGKDFRMSDKQKEHFNFYNRT